MPPKSQKLAQTPGVQEPAPRANSETGLKAWTVTISPSSRQQATHVQSARKLVPSRNEIARVGTQIAQVIFGGQHGPSGSGEIIVKVKGGNKFRIVIDAAEPPATVDRHVRQDDPLTAARARGAEMTAQILAGKDMLTAHEIGAKLGITEPTVNKWRQEGKLLGLSGPKRGIRYPCWQLNAQGEPSPILTDLIRICGGPWPTYRFLQSEWAALNGTTGVEALGRGAEKLVLELAQSVAHGNFL